MGLFRKQRSPYWWASYTGPDGRRAWASTGFTARRPALEWLERQKLEAMRQRADREDRRRRGLPEDPAGTKLGTFCRVYLFRHLRVRLKTRRAAKDQFQVLASFAKWFGPGRGLHEIDDAAIHRYQADYLGQNSKKTGRRRTPGTWNRQIQRLRHALNWAWQKSMVDSKPVRAWPMLPEPRSHPLPMTDELYARLLPLLPADMRHACELAVETLARAGEMTNWRRADVDLRSIPPRAVFRSTKSNEDRQIPLSPRAVEIVRELDERRPAGCETVLFLEGGGPWALAKTDRRTWTDACATAGIGKMRWHSLRAFGATRMAEAGVAETTLMEIGGWRSTPVFRRYRKSTWVERARAVGWPATPKPAEKCDTGVTLGGSAVASW